ncbi:putative FAD NAD binding oxidoreductase [Turdus rufiventris]|nr:putative FAD NAD binding oxidoreductase [Turdus rufiventris]
MPPPARRRLPPAARLPPRTFRSYLPRSHRTYSCVHCRAHLARHEELISKEQAFESSQKYKEGKFIIEMSHMVKENGWD